MRRRLTPLERATRDLRRDLQKTTARFDKDLASINAKVQDALDRRRAKAAGLSYISYVKSQGREPYDRSNVRFRRLSPKARFLLFAKLRNAYKRRRSNGAAERAEITHKGEGQ
jgi:hypothetical protein